MAVTFMAGFEPAAAAVEGVTLTGTASFSTAQARTGTRSIRCNPASGANGYLNYTSSPGTLHKHFGLYIATLPSVTRMISGDGNNSVLKLTSSGYIEVYNGLTLIGTSSVQLSTGRWYWIGHRKNAGTSVVLLQIDGVDQVTGTVGDGSDAIGLPGTESSSADIYIDDWVVSDAGFLSPSKVALLLPISDHTRDAAWTAGAGGTTNLWDAVDNTPPAGLATETNTSQIEHAGSAATTYYRANMTTYTTAGVNDGDTLLALRGLIVWGEDSATGTKLLSYAGYSNPTWTGEASIDVSTGDGSGATLNYGAGPPDYWNERRSAIATSPSVTLGTSPVMEVMRPESASRVASVCFMGMLVAWTPAAAAKSLPPVRPRHHLITR